MRVLKANAPAPSLSLSSRSATTCRCWLLGTHWSSAVRWAGRLWTCGPAKKTWVSFCKRESDRVIVFVEHLVTTLSSTSTILQAE